MKTVFKLAFRNFVAYKKLFIQLIVAFVALIFLITLISCFTLSINEMQNDIINGNISESYTFCDKPIDASKISQKFETQELTYLNLEEYVQELYGFQIGYVSASYIGVIYNGENCPYVSEEYLRFSAYAAYEWNIFSKNDYKEAGKNAQFMLGRFPENANEVVVSELYLEGCGLSADALGTKLSFGVVKYKSAEIDGNDDGEPPLVSVPNTVPSKPEIDAVIPITSELTVCGIILEDYYDLCGHSYGNFSPIILLDKSNAALSVGTEETMYMCSLDGWADKQAEEYFKAEDVYYVGDSSLRRINVTSNLKMVVNRLALYFGSALVLGIIISAFLLVEKLCSASVKNSGIMQISGFTGTQSFLVLLVQILFVSIIALVIAILFTYGAMTAINKILFHTFWITFSVSPLVYFMVVVIGLAIVVALSVATLGYVAFKRKGKQARDLLDT